MNQNTSKELVNHFIAIQTDTKNAVETQKKLDEKRFSRVEKALVTRPVFLPLSVTMEATGRLPAYYAKTPPNVNNDVLIIGAIADNHSRAIALRRSETKDNSFYLGDEFNTYMSVKDMAGIVSPSDKGQAGVFYFPSPFVVYADRRIALDVYKPDNTEAGLSEFLNLILIGITVNKRTLTLSGDEAALIRKEISFRPIPEVRFIKQEIRFDAAGAGGTVKNLVTPTSDEPLILRGVKSTLGASMIEAKIEGETDWTVAPIPIWALANEDVNKSDNYRYFERPIYLPAKTQIIMNLENGIGNDYDEQTGGTITWLAETV